MNQLLDIDELISENKRQENNRLNLFESILTQCHALIKRNNKERIRDMHYKVPAFIYGKPKFDIDVLRNYLVHHLKDNGLRVDIIDRYHLYISWKETDIDINKYMRRKVDIQRRNNDLYMVDNGTGPLGNFSQSFNHLKNLPHKPTMSRFEQMKFRQDKQRQVQKEREQRFKLQKKPNNIDFEEYIKRY